MGHRHADHARFLPGGDQHRRLAGKGCPFQLGPRDDKRMGLARQAQADPDRIHQEFIQRTEKEEDACEQKQFMFDKRQPLQRRVVPEKWQAGPLIRVGRTLVRARRFRNDIHSIRIRYGPVSLAAAGDLRNGGQAMSRKPPLLLSATRPLRALFVSDAFEGLLLILVAAAAIIAANSPLAETYHALFHHELAWTPVRKLDTLHLWINDALMAVFFFVVGLEVKREILAGSLADARTRRLPVLAAIAGMAAPAAIYLALAGHDPVLQRGWAIPSATDIAFAMGVVGLLGNRVPGPLRLFLLTVAIVDDIGAVAIIALFYTSGIGLGWLLASLAVLAAMIALGRLGVARLWAYAALALVLWYCVLNSGVHATIAGVAAALSVPMEGRDGTSPLERMEHGLVGWNAYLVVPLFGFANAGVSLAGLGLSALLAPLPLAIGAGLAIGKQAGIFACIVAADRLGIARKPADSSWMQVWGTAVLCGIGFTMSLFIGALAFPRHPLLMEEAKLGVLCGSLASAALGYVILRLAGRASNGGREGKG